MNAKLDSKEAGAISAEVHPALKPPDAQPPSSSDPNRKSPATDAPLAAVTFASRSIVTSEQSVAAVFILKRTQLVRGRASVQWSARSGRADSGIDFHKASGTARFADGQRQVAIYVPLRNDLLKEEDETFKVCLRSPQQARIGGKSCAEATILDDDGIGPT
ncbi:MAG TPA: Calx-beta domain-containing protein [Steroidobacter sp.]|uniref:Calx-beta domain-containing protein n=1 Tax=Steroidobacter sp. TaxID=1978227 RepID=UPI002EDA902B